MLAINVERLCQQLRDLVDAGPGVNDDALGHARAIIGEFRMTRSGDGVNDRLVALEDGFERWFSASNWNANFDAGKGCKQWLYSDIGGLEAAMSVWNSLHRTG